MVAGGNRPARDGREKGMTMMRIRSWSCIGVMVLAGAATPARAQVVALPQLTLTPQLKASSSAAPIKPSELNGVVRDELGKPLSGAVVSALGSTSAFAVSNEDGRFTFRNLPPGPYLVRAHLQNYLPSRSRVVQVNADGRTLSTIELTRKPGSSTDPGVIAAGVGMIDQPASAAPAEAEERHEHDELAWRLRHLKRSVLKDAENGIADLDGDDSLFGDSISTMSRAFGDSARYASSLFSDFPVNGQLNLLTSTSFDRPQDLFSLNGLAPRGVAYVSLEAPGATGDWRMRGTLTQGDLASWIVAGSYVRHQPAAHAYEAGVSYSMQRYLGANRDALVAMRDGSRNVGALYAMDNWKITPELQVSYGAKYARYDYLEDRGLISPRVTMILQPDSNDSLKVRTTIMHREVAPGAEEFIPPSVGLWLPPERTFSQVSRGAFVPERHDQLELAVDRQFANNVIVGIRAFKEQVEDQVVTVFGLSLDAPAEVGHYQVGSAGDFGAHGWGVTFTRTMGESFRATVDYTQAQSRWRGRSTDTDTLAVLAPSLRRTDETIHDVTASVESVLAASATRLLVVYKVNTAYAATRFGEAAPSAGVRFDVQVNQALPFLNFTSAQWEMLVAVSNLFKEALYENSVYDELMVVNPPKRVLGGVTVRF